MLTRLKMSGFKNLVDVDVRFGPFTCIAGPNGVGKSNLFDAILFLSALADAPLLEAALSVRDDGGRTTDVRSLFHRVGDAYDKEMSFEAEMIVPREGTDDLGQKARAGITFLRYAVTIGRREDESALSRGPLELIREDLDYIKIGDASKYLKFPHKADSWRKSVIQGRRTSPFISTVNEGGRRVIKVSQDGGGGRPRSHNAKNLPRTVLSTTTAAESPTALLARREMQSWRLLQLEPSALREPDGFMAPPTLGADGSHMPATLYHLAHSQETDSHEDSGETNSRLYERAASRVSELIEGVGAIHVDRDEKRELFTLEVEDRDGTIHPARSLSDGTLRFLALAALELDPRATGLICLEEPENGIHPGRVSSMLRLLEDIAVDVDLPAGLDNPFRQVIINTHSPSVVQDVDSDSLLMVEMKETVRDGHRFQCARFSWLPDTWRAKAAPDVYPVSKGKLLAYLNPVLRQEDDGEKRKSKKVRDMLVCLKADGIVFPHTVSRSAGS
ncbi:ATPase [Candidatus Desulfarcum epimagneticum]|uniref:ATPase n=1 Tax=uncultured Desulfobacteraceae bacterium TaxID=218296 RepID=A0A484HG99_9BACT|nr:ATPase [uncultured Desulfobacteraceae bacterium]